MKHASFSSQGALGPGAPLIGMALVRIVSGVVEVLAGVYMLRRASLKVALSVNAALGLVGPVALVVATVIGAVGLRTEMRPANVVLLFAGVLMIILAVS